MRPLYKLTLLGLLSGALFYPPILLLQLLMDSLPFFSPTMTDIITALGIAIPGIFFGYMIGSYFKKNHGLFIILSGAGTSLAIIANPILFSFTLNQYLATFIAATAGTSLMLLGFSKKLLKLTMTQFLLLAIFGGFLGLSFELWFSQSFQSILPLLWPTAMAAALGLVVEQNTQKHPAKKK